MSNPLRTAYYAATDSVSSLSSSSGSTYSDDSTRQRSSATSTPLALCTNGDADGGDVEWDRPRLGVKESLYEIEEEADACGDDTWSRRNRASVATIQTYASTVPSELQQQGTVAEEEYTSMPAQQRSRPSLHVSSRPHQRSFSSSPTDFAYYFPSTRLLRISHPDDCPDGNMNLTVQTEGWAAAVGDTNDDAPVPVPLVLYYFRMRNLKNREFSLRRYCRDSGREVCHTTRRYTRPATAKDGKICWQRRVENALNSLRLASPAKKRKTSTSSFPSLGRLDSGYASMVSKSGFPGLKTDADVEEVASPLSTASASATTAPWAYDDYHGNALHSVLPKATNLPLPTNTTKLEFSNYMHLDLSRRGGRGRGIKRYDFEHWGIQYSWHRRIVRKVGESLPPGAVMETVEFHLHATDPLQSVSRPTIVAHIVPDCLTAGEQVAEEKVGGWVPRSSLWISDSSLISGTNGAEVADVIVATGLLALVDDVIKRRWDPKKRLMDRMVRSLATRKPAISFSKKPKKLDLPLPLAIEGRA